MFNAVQCNRITTTLKIHKQMKNNYFALLFLSSTIILASCSDDEKNALAMYDTAQQYYLAGDYPTATLWVDSISKTYPQEVDVIRKGMVLQCNINQKRYEAELIYVDSMYNATNHELAELKPQFDLTREGKEQTLANYVYKNSRSKGEISRSELRSQVAENGAFQLTSIYCGSGKINHTAIEVECNGEQYATQSIAYDGGKNYRYTSGGKNIEMVTYNMQQCANVVEALSAGNDKITVRYKGDKKHSITIDKKSREAIAKTYRLARLMSLADSLQSRREYGILQLELADRQLIKLQEKQNNTEE